MKSTKKAFKSFPAKCRVTKAVLLRNSISLTFQVEGLSKQDRFELLKPEGPIGWLQFSTGRLYDIPDYSGPETKSPSKKLREALYVLYTKKEHDEDFDMWYAESMKLITKQIKDKLK